MTKQITMLITESQEHFLRMFYKNHHAGAIDNLGTRTPLHLVQTMDYKYEPVCDYTTELYEGNPGVELESDECGPFYKIPEWRTVAYFWILEEARRYKEYQAHNLNKPRTFTVSCGYANNGEYEHFFELLQSMGKYLEQESDEADKNDA